MPTCAVPEITGAVTSFGAPTTAAVGAEGTYAPAPLAFVARTAERIVPPTSPERSVYFAPVAPPMGRQLSPELSQRSHLYVKLVGEFSHVPFVVESVCATA